MVRVEHSLVIERPPAEVFAYTTDPDKLPEWQSTALEARSEGPVQQGAHMTEVRKFAEVLKQRAAYALTAAKYLTMRAMDVDLMTGLLLENRMGGGQATPEERAAARRQAAGSQGTYARIFAQSDRQPPA